jgi:hypothetical protein
MDLVKELEEFSIVFLLVVLIVYVVRVGGGELFGGGYKLSKCMSLRGVIPESRSQ